MSGALGGLDKFNVELLRRNRFCMGVKRGGEYVCGGDAGKDAKRKAVELLTEAVRRILRWRVWETWWIEETMDEWLESRDRLETQLRGKYGEEVVNTVTGLVDKLISYNERFWNYWHDVGDEVKRLVNDLLNGRTEVIIWESGKGMSVYREYITLSANKTRTGVTVHMVLNGLEGMTIEVPDVFRMVMSREEYEKLVNELLVALRGGLEEADGFVENGYAAMGTTQIWQVIVWVLLYFGKMHVYIDAVNVNESGVTITWHLKSSHDLLKGKILGNVDKLGEEELLAFMLGVVLGDGNARIEKSSHGYDMAVIRIAMSGEEFDRWEPLLMRLKSMGFRCGKPNLINGNDVKVRFNGSNAINLTRAMISVLPPILRDVLDALSFEKWVNLRRIAEMEVKFRIGESQVTAANYGFSVNIRKTTIMLMHKARDGVEARKVIDALRAVYGDGFYAYVNRGGKYLVIIIPMYVFERYDDIKEQVIEVLRRKLEKTKDEKKKQIITKHLTRLTPKGDSHGD